MQGRCKPNAIELARIAEAQPVLTVFECKSTTFWGISGIIASSFYIFWLNYSGKESGARGLTILSFLNK